MIVGDSRRQNVIKNEGPKQNIISRIKGRFSRKQWIIIGSVTAAIVLLGGGGASAWFVFLKPKPKPVVAQKPIQPAVVTPPAPTTVPSKLSGLEVAPDVNNRPVTAIMIENSPDARPQSGLKDASVVFEAIAEGGITRFNAIFQDTQPDYIGPVRSVRPYYIDWFWPFDASIAHVGGAPQGLADIKSLGIKDLDQFANSGAYQRVSTRYAPHNVYTSIAQLNALEAAKGFTTANFTGFPAKTPTASKIDIAISSFYYNDHYDYDPAANTYNRSEGGAPHVDERSKSQLSPKVVVAVVMDRGIASDGQHTEYQTTGSGKIFVFQDGTETEGTWSKADRKSQWKFTDQAGKELPFNPGQTWLTMVDAPGDVTYKP
jgi:hypothetical protein